MKLPKLNMKGNMKFAVGAFAVGIAAVFLMKSMKNKNFESRVARSLYANTIKFPELITRAGYNVGAFSPNDPDVTWTLPDLTDPKHDNILYNKVPYQGMQSAPTPPNFELLPIVGSISKRDTGFTTYF